MPDYFPDPDAAFDAWQTTFLSVVSGNLAGYRLAAGDLTPVTAAQTAAGVTVPDTTPTPSGPPTTAPVGQVDTSQRLQHTISFSDATTPTSKAKPAGVRGCEIWMKVGPPLPVTAADLAFVTLDTRTPHVIAFDGADANKTITYWLRWVSTRGETGPWSAAVSATVPG